MRGLLPAVAAVLGACVCQTAAAEPQPGSGGLTASELADARKLYVAKCAKCHEFYEPAAYKAEDWNNWMTKMGKKSRLTGDQLALLRRFTETLRSNPPAKRTQAE